MKSSSASMTASGEQLQYMPQLDGLRALAVLFVIYSHWVPREYHGGIPWGSLGVQLFFVLSGFLITGILLKVREKSRQGAGIFAITAFYARRCLRIFPLYYAVVVAIAWLGLYAARESLWWNVTYTTNIFFFHINHWPQPIAHFWSLAVEEQFYIMWPWVVMFVPRKWLLATISALIVTGVLATFMLTVMIPDNKFIITMPFAAWDALGGGALLAILGAESPSCKRFARWSLVGGACVWLWLSVASDMSALPISSICRHTGMVFVCIWAVWAIAMSGASGYGRLFCNKLLVGIGVISYGLYILHPYIPLVLTKTVRACGLPDILVSFLPLRVLCCLSILLLVAAVSWFLYERPLNQLKARFPYLSRPAGGCKRTDAGAAGVRQCE